MELDKDYSQYRQVQSNCLDPLMDLRDSGLEFYKNNMHTELLNCSKALLTNEVVMVHVSNTRDLEL